jgi:hypothetical protein
VTTPHHYVYTYTVGGVVWYVGKGTHYRDTDHLGAARALARGTPRKRRTDWHHDLREAIDRGDTVEITRVHEWLTADWAKTLEQRLIVSLKPLKNQQRTPKTLQATYLRKLECNACGYIVRTTHKWLQKGTPSCCCGAGPLALADDHPTLTH